MVTECERTLTPRGTRSCMRTPSPRTLFLTRHARRISGSHRRDLIPDPQSLQDLRRRFFLGKHVVADIAVLRDSVPLVRCPVLSVVAPETAGRAPMTEVRRVAVPSHLQLRVDVALVDGEDP